MTSKNTRARPTSPATTSHMSVGLRVLSRREPEEFIGCFSLAREACRLRADHATPGGGLASGLSKILRSTDRNKMDMAQASERFWTEEPDTSRESLRRTVRKPCGPHVGPATGRKYVRLKHSLLFFLACLLAWPTLSFSSSLLQHRQGKVQALPPRARTRTGS